MGSPSSGMGEPRSVKFLGLLRVLLRHGVDFFVVGGVAAQLEGAPILTLDLDVLYDKAPEHPVKVPLDVLSGDYAICRLPPDAPVPEWAMTGPLWTVARTADELSVVCLAQQVPSGVQVEPGWRALRVAGTLDFGLTGILA